jgi:oligopeptide transport system substrate-binding protein
VSAGRGVATDTFNKSAIRQLALLGLLAILALAGLMAALDWLSTKSGAGTRTGEAVDVARRSITLALASEPPQLDSTRATDQVSGTVLGHVMEGLLRYDARNEIVGGVAERWDIRADGATFHLRADARWSDGEPVTAHDFVFAWRRVVDPATASEYAFIVYPVRNAEAINRGELPPEALGVRAVDDRTLEVTFEQPVPYFDKLVAFATFLPVREDFFVSRAGRYGADADDLIYNGPFVISRWVHGAHLRFEKNPRYWDRDSIRLDVIDAPYITNDSNATLNLFKDGKIALAPLSSETIDNALQQRWHLTRFNDGSIFFLEFNHREGRLTRNYHLRRAIQLATDPGELVFRVLKLPGNAPAVSLFPEWLKGVKDSFRREYPPPVHRVDVPEARRALARALDELGLAKLPPLVLLSGEDPISMKQAEYLQNVYQRNLGITIKIDKQIFKQRLAKMTLGEFDMVLAGWGPDFADPLTFGDLFSSWNLNNRGRYANPELDRQVRIAQGSLDPKTRMDAFGEIQRILYEDAVILPNYERGFVFVTHPKIHGVVRRVVGADPDFTHAWVGEH